MGGKGRDSFVCSDAKGERVDTRQAAAGCKRAIKMMCYESVGVWMTMALESNVRV